MQSSQKHFAVYTSSVGNYFFREISDLIAAGLRQIGTRVTIRNENEKFLSDADWHVIVAPHEFFYLGLGKIRRKEGLPENSIIVNTEQPSTEWFALAYTMFRHAKKIWDIDHHSAENISALGFDCSYLPLGYVPGFTSYDKIENLPDTIAPMALKPGERKRSYLHDRWNNRPIDVLFMGTMSRKREEFFDSFDATASKYKSYLHKIPAGTPLVPGHPWYLGTSGSAGLAQRSKLVLNIHRGNDVYFEWQRVVMLGIWQRTLVISEPCTSAPPFKAGVDYVEATTDKIPALVDYYLSTVEGRQTAQDIIDHGYKTLTEDCGITDRLSVLVGELDKRQYQETTSGDALGCLADEPHAAKPAQSLRRKICVVLGRDDAHYRDYGGPAGMKRVASLLAAAGNDVTLLHLTEDWKKAGFEGNGRANQLQGHILNLTLPSAPSIHYELAGQHTIDSSNAYLWLRENSYDAIHFPETDGVGYYSFLAKHQGLAFQSTQLAVHIHGPARRVMGLASRHFNQVRDMEIDFMEQQSVALADSAVTQFDSTMEWISKEGWAATSKGVVMPYPPASQMTIVLTRNTKTGPANLVLVTTRISPHSLNLFSDSVEKLHEAWRGPIRIFILSLERPTRLNEIRNQIQALSSKLGYPVDMQVAGTIANMLAFANANPGLMMLLPPDENLQEIAFNLWTAGVPFLTASVDGLRSLIPNEEIERFLISPKASQIASRLKGILDNGFGEMKRYLDGSELDRAWSDWSSNLGESSHTQSSGEKAPSDGENKTPLVSVCIVHHNRRKYLAQALASIEAQDYPNFEVVLLDDGSDDPDALGYLAELEPNFNARGWKIVRQENKYLGAARNEAARHARGQYILFMDDDNVAKPGEISTYVQAALRTNADIVTCMNDVFSGESIPAAGQPRKRWLHLGPALSVGVFKNCFGDANALIRRETFETLGGFTEDYGITHEDWEFFAAAVFKGANLEVVPEALFWYRSSTGSMVKTTDKYANLMRSLRPYLNAVPNSLKPFFLFGLGLNIRSWDMVPRTQLDEIVQLVNASRTLFDMKQYEQGLLVMYAALQAAIAKGKTTLAKEIMGILRKPNYRDLLAKNGVSLDGIHIDNIPGDEDSWKPPVPTTMNGIPQNIPHGNENNDGKSVQPATGSGTAPAPDQRGRPDNRRTVNRGRNGRSTKASSSVPSNILTSASGSAKPLVSIILLVYNKLEYSKKCIESILENVKYENYEIIVSDNASTDGTQEFMEDLSKRLKHLKYVRNDSNLGYVGGNNNGVAAAKGEYVILLNNDTIVNPGWLESLVEFAEKTPDCGAVGSKLVYPDGRLQEAGGIIFSDGNGWNYGKWLDPNDPKFNFVREVDYISGASLMVRHDLWDAIGGLDERFSPAYFEDSDLCFAVRKHGYRVYYQPKSSIIHFEGITNGTDVNSGRKKFQIINRPKFIEKWQKDFTTQFPNDPKNVPMASNRGKSRSILIVDPTLPRFDRAAGSLHLFNILKILKTLHFHITFVSASAGLQEKYKPILEDMGIETYAGDATAMSFFGQNTAYPVIDYAKLFQDRNFDYAILNFWYSAEYYLPVIRTFSPHTKIIIDTEDVHFIRERREAEIKADPAMMKMAAEKKARELAIYKQADSVWVVTEDDRRALQKELGRAKIEIRPVVHETQRPSGNFENRDGLLFVGNFAHRPNIDAAQFFVREVMPIVAKAIPDIKLHVVGNDPQNLTAALASRNVSVHGYVEELSIFYEACRLSVAPLRYGAGLKGKIVESLSYGVPVVTTSIGVEGTGLRDGSDILVADDPQLMATRIADAYKSKDLWERLSVNGRSAMESRWSFETGRKMIEELLSPDADWNVALEKKVTSIIMLTYNQLEYTKLTIDSIRRHTKAPYELIVIDNASTDGTVEYLEAQKDIRTVFNKDNLGFPAGCNQGLEIASGNYVLLLNNDVIVTDDWLEGLIECAESTPSIGIVGSMSNRVSGLQLEPNPGYTKVSRVHEYAAKYRRKNRNKWFESPRVAGLCMLIKREVVEKIGGLDTAFGIGNCEDDDYCLRARLAGYKVAIAGDVFIHHFGSKSFGKDGWDKYKEFIKTNELVFRNKWGVAPLEWWREGKQITKTSPVYLPLRADGPNRTGSIVDSEGPSEVPSTAGVIWNNRGRVEELALHSSCNPAPAGSDNPDDIYENARNLAMSGKIDESILKFGELLKVNPNHAGALNDLGALYFQKGEKEKAIQHFRDSIEAYPLNMEALRNLADLYLDSGRIEDAMNTLKDILSIKPNDQESLQKIGYICALLGKPEDASFFLSTAQRATESIGDTPVDQR